MNTSIRDNLIDALTQFKISMAQLYVEYGRVFPSDSDRWADLAEEECQHAQWLTRLKIYLSNETHILKEADITIRRINRSLKFIEQQLSKAANFEFDVRDAVITALVIEDSALDSSFLHTFSFSSPNAEKIRCKLVEAAALQKEKLLLWLYQIENRVQLVA